jgi:iduronate 2-sulfatase
MGLFVATLVAILFSASALPASGVSKMKPTNFILIMFDDLRPELSIYGRDHMITPNFERLAARSVVFDNAYAQISVCNPSRDSLLTGLRPDTLGTYNFQSSFPPHLIMPMRFSKAGYNTAGYGKILHWDTDDKDIWNVDHWDGKWYGTVRHAMCLIVR